MGIIINSIHTSITAFFLMLSKSNETNLSIITRKGSSLRVQKVTMIANSSCQSFHQAVGEVSHPLALTLRVKACSNGLKNFGILHQFSHLEGSVDVLLFTSISVKGQGWCWNNIKLKLLWDFEHSSLINNWN